MRLSRVRACGLQERARDPARTKSKKGNVMTKAEIERLARGFFDAIEVGDIARVRDTYASDAVIWHNYDGKESTREENLATLDGFIKAVPSRRYTQRRLDIFDGGFVQRHRLVGKLANGKE